MSYLINKIIKEEIEGFLEEDYPQSFDMETFKSLTSFQQRIKYCEEHLQRMASGSARIVFNIDNEKVLKLAKNKKGIAQNEVEINSSDDYLIDDILADVFDYDEENYLWLEMEYCKKLSKGRFKQITGLDFKIYTQILDYIFYVEVNPQLGMKHYITNDPGVEHYVENNEFAEKMVDYLRNYQPPHGDLKRISSYGENKDGDVVIIDYGLNDHVAKTYYS